MLGSTAMRNRLGWWTVAAFLVSGCTVAASAPGSSAPGSSAPSSDPPRASAPPAQTTRALDPGQADRLKRIMVPLIQAMDHPLPLDKVKMGVVDDPQINAANAGEGEFYVTAGLLQKASDPQLTAVLAHEVAHEDLGHVAKAQRLNTGLGIGVVLLNQIFPGSDKLTPIAGTLVARAYSRQEEYQADRHGAELLERTGQSKQVMIDTLTWLMQTSGSDSGGFFATHPGTQDRIDALKSARAR